MDKVLYSHVYRKTISACDSCAHVDGSKVLVSPRFGLGNYRGKECQALIVGPRPQIDMPWNGAYGVFYKTKPHSGYILQKFLYRMFGSKFLITPVTKCQIDIPRDSIDFNTASFCARKWLMHEYKMVKPEVVIFLGIEAMVPYREKTYIVSDDEISSCPRNVGVKDVYINCPISAMGTQYIRTDVLQRAVLVNAPVPYTYELSGKMEPRDDDYYYEKQFLPAGGDSSDRYVQWWLQSMATAVETVQKYWRHGE